jgi:hypothetical protein
MEIKEKHPYWTKLTKPIRDPEFDNVLRNLKHLPFSNSKFLLSERFEIIYNFKSILENKIKSYVPGLNKIQNFYVTNGITNSIDSWITGNIKLGLYDQDYVYYQKIAEARNIECVSINNIENIKQCTKIIVSCPFSLNGNTEFQQLVIDQCVKYNIPIFIDLAYLGLTEKFMLDVSKVKDLTIAYSMSKHYSLCFDRIGATWTTKKNEELAILNQVGYVNISGIQKSIELLNTFDENYIFSKYKHKYQEIINQHNLQSTNCVLLAHKNNEKFCITEFLI